MAVVRVGPLGAEGGDLQGPSVGEQRHRAVRQAGVEVVGMVASYTYGFPVAEQAFAEAGVTLVTLTDYEHVVAEALATGYIAESDTALLHAWREDPAHWMQK